MTRGWKNGMNSNRETGIPAGAYLLLIHYVSM
jgi:hypothetical protein